MNRLFAKLHKDLTTAPVRLIRMSILGLSSLVLANRPKIRVS